MRQVAWVVLVGLAAVGAPAAAAAPDCIWSDIVRDGAQAAVVRPGAARVHFSTIAVLKAGCPDPSPRCRNRAYLVPGNVVLAGSRFRAFTCVGYNDGRAMPTIGWFPTAALQPLPAKAPGLRDWAGHWSAPEQEIDIAARADGRLTVDGEATWGSGDPERVRIGGVHTGAIEGRVRPVNGVVAFAMGETATLPYRGGDAFTCRVRMIRRGPYLLVRDNQNCGGQNVDFTGFYARSR